MAKAQTAVDLIGTREVSEMAGVDIATVTRWVAAKRLKPVHKGKGLRGPFLFDRAAVEKFLAERAKAKTK
jgi:phage terminase Nu1 subunit (DNA packaging protein)